MGNNSELVLAVVKKKGEVQLSELPNETNLPKNDVYAAVQYLKKLKKVKTIPLFSDLRFTIVLLSDE